MSNETAINIRCANEEKDMIKLRAESMHMTMTEYMIHAALSYTPSDEVMKSIEAFNSLLKRPMFMVNIDDTKGDEAVGKL